MRLGLKNIVACLLLGMIAAGCKPAAKALNVTVPADFVSHTTKYGVIMKSPPTWKEREGSQTHVALVLMAPDKATSVNLVIIDSPVPSRNPNVVAKEVENEVGKQLGNFTLKTAESILVAGEDCPRIVYEGNMLGRAMRFQQTMIGKNGKTFIVTYTSLPGQFDQYTTTIDQMLASMTIP